MALARRIRFEILRRDGHTCRYCGASAPDVKLTVDHVIPVALGGSDEPNNLVTACEDCNGGKTSTAPDQTLVDDVDATAMLFAKAMERAAELRRQEEAVLGDQLQAFKAAWDDWTYPGPSGERLTLPLEKDWEPTIERFISYGLGIDEFTKFIHHAMSSTHVKDPWRYVCKRCWNEIGDRQEMARRLIEDGEV